MLPFVRPTAPAHAAPCGATFCVGPFGVALVTSRSRRAAPQTPQMGPNFRTCVGAPRAPRSRRNNPQSAANMSGGNNKRPADGAALESAIDLGSTDEDEPAPKRLNPNAAVFQMPSTSSAAAGTPASVPPGSNALRGVLVPAGWSVHGSSLLVWEHTTTAPSGKRCLTGCDKIAAFDFDGCLANTPLGGSDPTAWKMQYPHVPQVLRSLVSSGYKIIIVTNESSTLPHSIRAPALCVFALMVLLFPDHLVPCQWIGSRRAKRSKHAY